jgi:hypothetical protein
LRKIQELGRGPGCFPLGQNWPFSPREFDWEQGKYLEEARRDLSHLVSMLEIGRGDEILIHPLTRKPLK